MYIHLVLVCQAGIAILHRSETPEENTLDDSQFVASMIRADALLAGCARSCTRRAALSRRNPRRSSVSPCGGLRSSSGPQGCERAPRIHPATDSSAVRNYLEKPIACCCHWFTM